MGGTANSGLKRATEVGPIGECERVPFEPSIEVQPTTRSAESPTGLNVSLVVPQSVGKPVLDRDGEPEGHDASRCRKG